MGWRPFILGVLLAGGLVQAQDQRPEEQKPKDQDRQDQQAADQQTEDQQASQQTYQGPSILARDKGLIGQRGGRLIDFRFYGDVTGVYDTGLVPITTDAKGNLINVGAAYGVETGFGVIGTRRWKREELSLEYRGAYRDYNNKYLVQGLDQFLNLAYERQLTRHVSLNLKETAGSVSLANGAFAYLPLTGIDLFAVPANELFDIRTNFLQSRVDLVWQKTARLSFDVGGEGFVVRRSSLALAGLNGYDAHANVAYRLTGRQTVSAAYSNTYFDFQREFGNARLQTTTLGYSIALSKYLDLSLQGGGIRVDSLGLTVVSLDPAIAAILGRNVAIVSFLRVVYLPLIEARLTRTFSRSALTLDYAEGASPGNGVYLTSRQTAGSIGYSYTGYRRLTVGANAAYNELSTVGQTLGKYTNLQGGGGMTYKLGHDTHLEVRYDYRHYTTQNFFYQKNSNRVSLGLAFSPGETPLAIW